MNTINIGIVAHVDAGKTTLTENLIYLGGAIKNIGRVDFGNTITDSMELEKKRGITIKASAVSFNYKNVKINIIDTPGHADFISEVQRSLSILDGAILVVSAVEGIQAHTLLLFNTLKALKVPTIIFVNKLDRLGARYEDLVKSLRSTLDKNIIPLQKVSHEGTYDVAVKRPYEEMENKILYSLCSLDENLLERYVNEERICTSEIKSKVKSLSRSCRIYPVLFGSALKELGIDMLLDSIINLIPYSKGDDNKPLSAVVFKIDAEEKEKKAYLRLFDGKISTRDKVNILGHEVNEKVTGIDSLINGNSINSISLYAGDIGIVYGLKNVKTGDIIGRKNSKIKNIKMAEPTLKVVISPTNSKDKKRLFEVLSILCEEDPLLCLEVSDFKDEIYINLYGEVQMEIIKEIIEERYKIKVSFSELQTIYKETPHKEGEAKISLNEHGNPFRAGVGIKISPLLKGSGVKYFSEVSYGDLSKTFQNAVEEAVFNTLKQGLLGWEVTDIKVTFTYSNYDSVTSTPSAFRDLTPMVLMEALNKAKTDLLEPLYDFSLKANKCVLGKAISDLKSLRASISVPTIDGENFLLKGLIPADTSKKYKTKVASYTEGKGIFITNFSYYEKIPLKLGKVKEKIGIDPLNKDMYILYKSKAIK